MRILQVITDQQLRGAQVFASQLSGNLASRGHQVCIVSLYATPGIEPALPGNVRKIELGGQKRMLSISLCAKLRKVIRDYSPDLIQCNGSDTLKYTVLAARFLKSKPKLVYRNISMAGSWVAGGWQRSVYRSLFDKVHHVASLTASTKQEFISVYQYPAGKISVLPIGVEISGTLNSTREREALAKLSGFDMGSVFLVHIGAYSPEKNHAGLFRIFRKVRESVPSAVLVCAGTGPMEKNIRHQIDKMNLGKRVSLLGQRADVMDWLGGAAVFLLPSLIEGLPGVLLEAMGKGVPPVAYGVGAIPQLIANGEDGFVVTLNDETEFANKVVELVRSESLRLEIGARASAKVRGEYGMARITGMFEELYEQLVSNV